MRKFRVTETFRWRLSDDSAEKRSANLLMNISWDLRQQGKSFALFLVALLFLSWPSLANAQDQNNIRTQLDALRLELDGIEAGINSRPFGDGALQESRSRVDVIAQSV
jgi:hypothetical protein